MTATPALASPHRLRPRTVLALLAGRGAFRLGNQAAAVVLAVAWGSDTFGAYANAVGLGAWLMMLPGGAEKAALKLIPRRARLGDEIARVVLVTAAAPLAVVLGLLAVAAALDRGSTATLYLAAAAVSATTGMLLVVAGLHRLRGRPAHDTRAFLAGAVAVGVVTLATVLLDLRPVHQLGAVLVALAAVLVALVAALPHAWRDVTTPARRRVARSVVRTSVLLSAYELFDGLALSVVFAVLAASGRTEDSGPVYLGLVVAAAVGSILVFLMRLAQPATSLRLRGAGASAGRRRAVGLLRAAEWLGLALAVAVAVALVLGAGAGPSPVGALVALVAVEIVLYAIVTYAVFLLENTGARALATTSSAAVAGFLATGALAAVLVPRLGAAGALAAIVLGLAVKAGAVRHRLPRAPGPAA